jgi:hypothetical protein
MVKIRTEEYGGGKLKRHYVTTRGKGAGKRKAKLKGKFVEKGGKVKHVSGKKAGAAVERARKRSLAEKIFGVPKRTTKDVIDRLSKSKKVIHTVQKKKIKKNKNKAK